MEVARPGPGPAERAGRNGRCSRSACTRGHRARRSCEVEHRERSRRARRRARQRREVEARPAAEVDGNCARGDEPASAAALVEEPSPVDGRASRPRPARTQRSSPRPWPSIIAVRLSSACLPSCSPVLTAADDPYRRCQPTSGSTTSTRRCRTPARRRPRRPHHLLAEGLHPAHDAVPRPLRLLHVRQAAGPPRRAVPHRSTRCSRSPGAVRPPGVTRRCSRSARRPRSATRRRASGSRHHGYASTVDYLVAACPAVLDETGLLPHANAGALGQAELERLRAVRPSQGMMIETLAAPPRRARRPARRRARQDPRAPPRHARGRGRAAVPVHHRDPRRHRRDPRRADRRARSRSATRTPRHGHVQEVIVQNFLPKPGTAMAKHAAVPARRVPVDGRRRPARARRRDAPPGAAEPLRRRRARRARRRRDRRLGRRLPRHARPREPRTAVARARPPARRHRGRGQGARAAPHRLPGVRARPRALARTPTCASRCWRASDLEGLARDDDWAAGGERRHPPALLPPARSPRRLPASARPVGEVLDGVRAGEEVGVDEIVTLLGARGPEVAAVAAVADELRRETVGDVVTFVRNRNINYTNICTFKCRFCAFSKGPLSLNLRGDAVPARPRGDPAPRRRGRRVRRHRGVPPGRHPPRLRRRLLPVGRAGGEGGRADDPPARLHRARGHRRRAPPRHAAARLPRAGQGRRASRRCPAPRPRSSTTRCARSSAPTRSTPRSGSRPTASRTRSGCARTSRSCSGTVERPVHVARHLVRTRDLQKETGGFTEFVPLPFVHMAQPDLPPGEVAPRARRSARCC